MNKLSILAMAAALVATPAIALAQDVNVGVSTAVDTAASAAGADAGASADVSANGTLTFDGLLGDLGSADATADISAVAAVTAATTINIVELLSLEGMTDTSAKAVADAKASNSTRLGTLQAAVAANAAIQAKLAESGHDTDDVVAVKVDAQGALWVYVDEAE